MQEQFKYIFMNCWKSLMKSLIMIMTAFHFIITLCTFFRMITVIYKNWLAIFVWVVTGPNSSSLVKDELSSITITLYGDPYVFVPVFRPFFYSNLEITVGFTVPRCLVVFPNCTVKRCSDLLLWIES